MLDPRVSVRERDELWLMLRCRLCPAVSLGWTGTRGVSLYTLLMHYVKPALTMRIFVVATSSKYFVQTHTLMWLR
jgi:hypothetical protein